MTGIVRREWAFALSLASFCALCVGCGWKPQTDQERVIAEAYTAIAAHDWAAFEKHTVTPSDIINRQQGVSRFERSQTFAGSVLKPEEMKVLHEQFDLAVAGGAGQVDFASAKIIAVTETDSGELELLSGGPASYVIFTLTVKDDSGADVTNLKPRFVLTPHGSFWNILALDFTDPE